MTRYRTYGPLDDELRDVGDALLRGLNSREDSSTLPAGFVSEAKNVRLDDGAATTRNGYVQKVSLGVSVFSAGYYGGMGKSDQNQVALFQADQMKLWNGVSIATVGIVSLASSLGTFTNTNEAIQFNNKIILFKGMEYNLGIPLDFYLGGPAQVWNGDPADDFQISLGIPESRYGIVVGDRLAVQSDKDEVAFSDLSDHANFDILNKFVFGKGDGDDVVGFAPVSENACLVFKQRSIWAISDLELLPNAQITQVSESIGCVNRHSIQSVGSTIFFLADKGVYIFDVGVDASNTRGILTQYELRGEAVSKPINDQILAEDMADAAVNARSVFFDNRYWLAFKDGAGSKVYVFNTLLDVWESRDAYDFNIIDFAKVRPTGETVERLYAASPDGKLRLLGQGALDGAAAISWAMNTRHYGGENLGVESWRRGSFSGETLESGVSIAVTLDVRDPDTTDSFTASVPAGADENFLTRFGVRKRGQSLSYQFAGSGLARIRALRAEVADQGGSNLTTKFE